MPTYSECQQSLFVRPLPPPFMPSPWDGPKDGDPETDAPHPQREGRLQQDPHNLHDGPGGERDSEVIIERDGKKLHHCGRERPCGCQGKGKQRYSHTEANEEIRHRTLQRLAAEQARRANTSPHQRGYRVTQNEEAKRRHGHSGAEHAHGEQGPYEKEGGPCETRVLVVADQRTEEP